jgi:hypothetical protein
MAWRSIFLEEIEYMEKTTDLSLVHVLNKHNLIKLNQVHRVHIAMVGTFNF